MKKLFAKNCIITIIILNISQEIQIKILYKSTSFKQSFLSYFVI